MKSGTWSIWATSLKQHTYALYLASRDSSVPICAKILIGLVVAYALSPIDLIPDFIPIIGYFDDLILLPLGIWAAIQLIHREVWKECQNKANEQIAIMPKSNIAAISIITIWLIVLIFTILWGLKFYDKISNT